MADDQNGGATPSVETLQAQLASAQAELAGANARIKELNQENGGHRLNANKYKGEADAAQKARDDAIAEAARIKAEIEASSEAKIKEAETKRDEALTKAQQRAVNADLRVAAKDAGMVDLDGLALLDRTKIKTNDDGDVVNAAELMADLKKAKPFLFGSATTSSTHTPPKNEKDPPKSVREMTPDQIKVWEKEHGITRR